MSHFRCVATVVVAIALSSLPPAGSARADGPHYADLPLEDVLAQPVAPSLSTATKRRFAGRTVSGRYAAYLGPRGDVHRVEPLTSMGEADADVMGSLQLVHYAAPGRFARVVVPVTIAPSRESLDFARYREVEAPQNLEGLRHILVTPNEPGLSAELKQRYAGQHPTGEYTIYLDLDGRVTKLEIRRSIAGVDDYIRRVVERRVFPKPFARIRFVEPVELTFPAPPHPPAAGAPVKYRSVPPTFLQLASGEPPRLPDAFKAKHLGESFRGGYMVYVEADGRVSRVEVVQSVPECDEHIMAGLRTWKYVAPKEPIRSIVQINWSLNLNPRP